MAKLRHLNDQGGRRVANIVARNSGPHPKGAPPEKDGGVLSKTYLCNGASCIATSAVLQEWGIYNGAVGEVVDIVSRAGERPPASLPVVVLARFPKYCGPSYLDDDQKVVHIAPIGRLLDCRLRFPRIMIPLAPAWGCVPKEPGATCGAGRDAECVVARPITPSFGKSHHVGIYDACSRAKSAGRGSYGEPGYEASALYLQPICSSERILIRVDNQMTDGRGRGARRIEDLAAATRARRPNLLQEYGDIAEWAEISILPEELAALFGAR